MISKYLRLLQDSTFPDNKNSLKSGKDSSITGPNKYQSKPILRLKDPNQPETTWVTPGNADMSSSGVASRGEEISRDQPFDGRVLVKKPEATEKKIKNRLFNGGK